jgi:hypothetical protein
MVRFNQTIQNTDLPTVANNFFPNPAWSSSDSFDYKQYYDKKKGLRSFEQARSINRTAPCKSDENFKIDNNTRRFYNFTDYKTRMNVSKYYQLIHPYCELNENGTTTETGQEIFDNTIIEEGIAGRNSNTPYVNNVELTPTVQNKIKGGLSFNQCINFKNGFKPNVSYRFD